MGRGGTLPPRPRCTGQQDRPGSCCSRCHCSDQRDRSSKTRWCCRRHWRFQEDTAPEEKCNEEHGLEAEDHLCQLPHDEASQGVHALPTHRTWGDAVDKHADPAMHVQLV